MIQLSSAFRFVETFTLEGRRNFKQVSPKIVGSAWSTVGTPRGEHAQIREHGWTVDSPGRGKLSAGGASELRPAIRGRRSLKSRLNPEADDLW
jgi:hypothetical protein